MTSDRAWADALSWLHLQLDEDERVARSTFSRINGGTGRWSFRDMQVRDDRDILIVRYTWPNEGEHITRHDPAAILRRVESDRRILAYISDQLADHGGDNPWWYDDRLTPIVQALARRYAGAPDFPDVLRAEGERP